MSHDNKKQHWNEQDSNMANIIIKLQLPDCSQYSLYVHYHSKMPIFTTIAIEAKDLNTILSKLRS